MRLRRRFYCTLCGTVFSRNSFLPHVKICNDSGFIEKKRRGWRFSAPPPLWVWVLTDYALKYFFQNLFDGKACSVHFRKNSGQVSHIISKSVTAVWFDEMSSRCKKAPSRARCSWRQVIKQQAPHPLHHLGSVLSCPLATAADTTRILVYLQIVPSCTERKRRLRDSANLTPLKKGDMLRNFITSIFFLIDYDV